MKLYQLSLSSFWDNTPIYTAVKVSRKYNIYQNYSLELIIILLNYTNVAFDIAVKVL